MKIAIIDLGSNSARMTIWKISGSKIEVVVNKRLYVRLSEGLSEDNLIKEEPFKRTLSALLEFSDIIKHEKCEIVKAVATETIRRAENSDEILKIIYAKTGIKIEILTGDEEARYDYLAAEDLAKGHTAFLMDVGGGSIEIIRADRGELQGHISLPLGAVVATDAKGRDIDSLMALFTDEFSLLPFIEKKDGAVLIGLGGSIRSLFSYAEKLYDGATMSRDEFFEVYDKIVTEDREILKQRPSFSDRYDIINAGITPYAVLFKLTGADKITLCNRGVREGILIECLKKI